MKVIDATDAVVGRMAARVAKMLLQGEEVAIVNAEKAVVSGSPKKIVEKYFLRRKVQQKANPEESPKWPRRPDLLLKRIIRGMLPKKSARGKNALRKLRCYIGVPKEFEGKSVEKIVKTAKDFNCRFISIQKVCEKLGWHG
jgi:large subunit ribosomal protein L13